MLSDTQDAGVIKTEEEQVVLSKARRYTLLALVSLPIGNFPRADSPQFCSTQFVDVYNASAIVLATADVSSSPAPLQYAYSQCQVAKGLDMGATEGVWTLSAYVLTFASFMLPVSSLNVAVAVLTVGLVWKNRGYLERKGNAGAWYSLGRRILDRNRGHERQGRPLRLEGLCRTWVRPKHPSITRH
jgi:hypothetical protein